ncbi:YceI family protein [Epilithonimonas ginsengisoli]|uniref:YceI family protein n=1 Tax=Epilithonimonas ginsengisoli TaxID=1245592 RepID=A0ABU4JDZ6_9FLAO|nr:MULTISPECIES: YceI family protein [Chryseobacterium group]MBV6879048.1 YceI family protein [Epilithonimonas sp. FP105]MDW8547895.1 YceI family protein [Epilithonimonas ginsengisoli]OAH74956.1 polyisoprenoid-binding protein [Chryseobacterium sp. FP211-J200]
MKKTTLISAILLISASVFIISCGKDKPVTSESNEVLTTSDGQIYVVDTLNSKAEWKGFKVVKSDNTSHIGGLKFESGEVTVKDKKLESGQFVIDMTSLSNEDLKDAESNGKLLGHLKSADFFDTGKFPTASYEITKVIEAPAGSDYNTVLDGNLTLKGIIKPFTFNANVKVAEGELTIATEPKDINRDEFGIKFQMPAAEGLIKNEINIQVKIKAIEKK